MLEVVHQSWYMLAAGKDPLDLSIDLVAEHLAFKMEISDKSNALKYIRAVTNLPEEVKTLDWDEYFALYCRGIFIFSLITAATTLLTADKPEDSSQDDNNLMVKLIISRVKHLWTAVEPSKVNES
jgi:hypothetical protein